MRFTLEEWQRIVEDTRSDETVKAVLLEWAIEDWATSVADLAELQLSYVRRGHPAPTNPLMYQMGT